MHTPSNVSLHVRMHMFVPFVTQNSLPFCTLLSKHAAPQAFGGIFFIIIFNNIPQLQLHVNHPMVTKCE